MANMNHTGGNEGNDLQTGRRLVAVARLLRTRPWTSQELATQLDINERTVRRTLRILEQLEIGLEVERGTHGKRQYALPRFPAFWAD